LKALLPFLLITFHKIIRDSNTQRQEKWWCWGGGGREGPPSLLMYVRACVRACVRVRYPRALCAMRVCVCVCVRARARAMRTGISSDLLRTD
jgi:hypothetical protein